MPNWGQTINRYGHSYQELSDFLGDRGVFKISETTHLVRFSPTSIAVQYHDTRVITFYQSGNIVLIADGFYTKMTKEKISAFLPQGTGIFTEKGYWYVSIGDERQRFYDGIILDTTRMCFYSQPEAEELRDDMVQENTAVLKQIDRYVKNLTQEKAEKAIEDMAGDCYDCSMMIIGKNQTMGELNGRGQHLLSHMEEGYYPGTLLIRAYTTNGYTAFALQIDLMQSQMDRVRRNLRRYLKKQILEGVMV